MSARPTAQSRSEFPKGAFPKFALDVPDELIEMVAKRAAQLILDAQPGQTWASADEAAERLRCPRSRVYELAARGDLTVFKDGTRSLFKVADLDAYIESSAS